MPEISGYFLFYTLKHSDMEFVVICFLILSKFSEV